MSARSDVIYVYDGSFEGLLTAVFESFESRELPCSIVAEDEFVPTLFSSKTVDTDPQKADRVRRGLKKTGADVWNTVRLGYLTCLEDRGTLIKILCIWRCTTARAFCVCSQTAPFRV